MRVSDKVDQKMCCDTFKQVYRRRINWRDRTFEQADSMKKEYRDEIKKGI
jgi:hypothetical protein